MTDEKQLMQEVTTAEGYAMSLAITDDASYQYAGELAKTIKVSAKMVEDYWEPMRESAYSAYKAVMAKKSEMIDPLKRAEKIVKDKIGKYLAEIEKARKAQEEELKRQAEEERKKKEAEAAAAEQAGDFDQAFMLFAEAKAMEGVAETAAVQIDARADGISRRADWKITKIDEEKVPVSVGDVVIRPVDEKAVLALIRASKGKVTISGVEFEESSIISVRKK